MAFVKARSIKSNEMEIFNTEMIVKMNKRKNGYIIFFSSGNLGSAFYEFDEENAKIFLDAIGMTL